MDTLHNTDSYFQVTMLWSIFHIVTFVSTSYSITTEVFHLHCTSFRPQAAGGTKKVCKCPFRIFIIPTRHSTNEEYTLRDTATWNDQQNELMALLAPGNMLSMPTAVSGDA
jgi:hypothetical protein